MEPSVPQKIKDNNELNNKNETSFSQELKTKTDIDTSKSAMPVVNHRFYYSVGNFNILLEQDIRAENLSPVKIYELPHPPFWCVGIVNVRGIIVPVVNMNILFETEAKTAIRKSKYLLLQHENFSPIILQIDELPTMIDFDNYSVEETTENSPSWSIKHLKYKSNTIHEVRHNHLLKQLSK